MKRIVIHYSQKKKQEKNSGEEGDETGMNQKNIDMSQSEIIFEVNIRKPIEKTQDDSSNDNYATIITKSEMISYDDNIELEHSKNGNHHDSEDKESNSTICVEINAMDTTEISARGK